MGLQQWTGMPGKLGFGNADFSFLSLASRLAMAKLCWQHTCNPFVAGIEPKKMLLYAFWKHGERGSHTELVT